jgi:hypothetical protein
MPALLEGDWIFRTGWIFELRRVTIMIFLPPIERSGEIKFYLLKSLPYYPRLYLISGLLMLGLALQIIYLSVFAGIFFILGAVSLGLASGYESGAEIEGSPFWKEVNWEAFEEITKLNKRSEQWDKTFLDITNLQGFLLLFVIVIQAVVVWFYLTFGADGWEAGINYLLNKIEGRGSVPSRPWYGEVGSIYLTNVLALTLPFWFTGIRRILKKDKLVIQVEELLAIRDTFEKIAEVNEDTFVPMLETRAAIGGEGDVPSRVHFKVLFKNMPKTFYGLQAQVNINDVQGKSYPYFYCVLVGEEASDLQKFKSLRSPPFDVVTEYQKRKGVKVLVIRKYTTKTSGYYVRRRKAIEIFRYAYELGSEINQTVQK